MSQPNDSKLKTGAVITITILVGLIVIVLGALNAYTPGLLQPSSPEPDGARAITSVLQDQGYEVKEVKYISEAKTALDNNETVFVTDPNLLTQYQLQQLKNRSGELVLIAPDNIVLTSLGLDIFPRSKTNEPAAVATRSGTCAVSPLPLATEISWGIPQSKQHERNEKYKNLYSGSLYVADGEAKGCFTGEGKSNEFAFVKAPHISVVGGPAPFTNSHLKAKDNAAFALNLLRSNGHKINWYIPTPEDPQNTDEAAPWDYLPPIIPFGGAWLLLTTFLALAAAFFRLGPVVVEPLPNRIAAGETTRARGRLLMKRKEFTLAAEELREGTRRRLLQRVHAQKNQTLATDLQLIADHSNLQFDHLEEVFNRPIQSNRDLLRLANDLLNLEKELRP